MGTEKLLKTYENTLNYFLINDSLPWEKIVVHEPEDNLFPINLKIEFFESINKNFEFSLMTEKGWKIFMFHKIKDINSNYFSDVIDISLNDIIITPVF